ncbi:protein disulfide-isomerase 5-1 [Capsicum galapagoense]
MKLYSLILLCCIFLLSSMYIGKAEVITLTGDTFNDKINEKDTAWFVKFCVPWCKHCKNLGTLWDDLGKTMEGEDEIEVGQVDCGTDKPVCNKVDIHSYPTFKLFYNGEEVAKYQGRRFFVEIYHSYLKVDLKYSFSCFIIQGYVIWICFSTQPICICSSELSCDYISPCRRKY